MTSDMDCQKHSSCEGEYGGQNVTEKLLASYDNANHASYLFSLFPARYKACRTVGGCGSSANFLAKIKSSRSHPVVWFGVAQFQKLRLYTDSGTFPIWNWNFSHPLWERPFSRKPSYLAFPSKSICFCQNMPGIILYADCTERLQKKSEYPFTLTNRNPFDISKGSGFSPPTSSSSSEDEDYIKEVKKRIKKKQGTRSDVEYEETEDGLREVKVKKEKEPWAGKPGSRMGRKKKKGKNKK
ncbi:hypothetical protein RhiirA4_480869 [Rhizophagus irregularis]|uniref:Uncharacterized protein n=1 Tax=Rhizophagus irregularis TaxID=588596 RepID=A0A2I1HIK4_9GLOM|nr:hypothetical protein RhiirA4_480869 [Rhizophagus irregularis]